MKKKNLISLSVAFAFLALSITGILIFLKQKTHAINITHTIFGLVFVGFAIFHILNNWSSITGYSKERKSGNWQRELIYAAIGFLLLLIGGLTEILEPVAEAGRIFAKQRPRPNTLSFTKIETNSELSGSPFNIMIEFGKDVKLPVVAAWTETETGQLGEDLFVPSKIAVAKEEDEPDEIDYQDFDKNILPVFAKNHPNAKPNFEKETPKENFILSSKTSQKFPFQIALEVKAGVKSEIYKIKIDTTANGIYKLKGAENGLIQKIIVEKL